VRWIDVEQHQQRLAELARARLLDPGVALIATMRLDGTPRLSPVEPGTLDGDPEPVSDLLTSDGRPHERVA